MPKKKRLIYYSDCPFFAGCENMIPNFLNSNKLNDLYDIYFIYRESKDYKKELYKRLNSNKSKCIPISLPNFNIHNSTLINLKKYRSIYKILVAFIHFFLKYYVILFSIYPLYKEFKKLNINMLHINNGGYPAAITAYSLFLLLNY